MTENQSPGGRALGLARRRIVEQIRRLPRRRALAAVLLLAILATTVAVWKLARPSEATLPTKKIVFLGRQADYTLKDADEVRREKDHDQFHFAALSHHLEELERELGTVRFELEYHSNDKEAANSEIVYNDLANDPSVVLVVDNTWGAEFQGAAAEIVKHSIPVIALNADKGDRNFNNQVIFLGADDSTPDVMVNFLTKVLLKNEATFITEASYPLKEVFRGVFDNTPGLKIYDELPELEGDKPLNAKVTEAVENLAPYLEDEEARRRPIILNVHGDWGSKLVAALDERYSDLTLLAGGSAANEKFDARRFGVPLPRSEDREAGRRGGFPSNRFFVNYSAAEDVISERTRADMNRLRPDFEEYMETRNATLFLSRVHEATTLIREALKLQKEEDEAKRQRAEEDRRKDEEKKREAEAEGRQAEAERLRAEIEAWKPPEERPVNRGTFLRYMGHLASLPIKCVTTPYDLLDFNEALIRKKDVQFVLHQGGESNTYLLQLNRSGGPIPNIRMGIQVVSIYDIDVSSGDFGADFFYWTEERKPAEPLPANDSDGQGAEEPANDSDGQGAEEPANDSEDQAAADWLAKTPVLFKNLKEPKISEEPITIEGEDELYKLHRLSGRFYTQFNIKDYPLDRQHLRIEAEVLNPSDFMRLSFDNESLRTADVRGGVTEVDEWSIEEFYLTVDNEMGKALYGRTFPRECNQKFKHLTAHVIVKRRFADAFLTVVVPLVLIGLVAISLLFVRDTAFHAVGDAAIGVFLGIMAFLIALTDIAPDLSQISRGGILFWSTFIVVVLVILVIVGVNSSFVGEKGQAVILRVGKIAIPALYILVLVLVPLL